MCTVQLSLKGKALDPSTEGVGVRFENSAHRNLDDLAKIATVFGGNYDL